MGARKDKKQEKKIKLAQKPVTPLTFLQYVKITSPLLDKTRSPLVRFIFLVKYIVILVLIVFCFQYVITDVIDYWENGNTQTTKSFLVNRREFPVPGISVCHRVEMGSSDCGYEVLRSITGPFGMKLRNNTVFIVLSPELGLAELL